jgi:hypothetical protein
MVNLETFNKEVIITYIYYSYRLILREKVIKQEIYLKIYNASKFIKIYLIIIINTSFVNNLFD